MLLLPDRLKEFFRRAVDLDLNELVDSAPGCNHLLRERQREVPYSGSLSTGEIIVHQVLGLAAHEALAGGHTEIGPEHILMALLKLVETDANSAEMGGFATEVDDLRKGFQEHGVFDTTSLRRSLRAKHSIGPPVRLDRFEVTIHRTESAREIFRVAAKEGGASIRPRHLLDALMQTGGTGDLSN